MSGNPFNFGKPVKGKDFYNRKEEIERAIGFIKNLQCFSILGERRIGKTSLLEHVLSREVLEEHGVNPEKTVIVSLNMGSLYKVAKDVFIEALLKQLREHTQIGIESPDIFEVLEEYIKNLVSEGKRVIIALDEFEIVAHVLDEQLSHWLRSIFQTQNVMGITVSHKTVRYLEKSGGIASPLFNIFANLTLGLFSKEDSEYMIRKMFQRGGIGLKEEEISFLICLSGENPYFIQLVGYHYYEERKRKKGIDNQKFKNNMLYFTKDQFEWYWDNLDDVEKEFLLRSESTKDRTYYTLERKGYLMIENRKIKVFSDLFREFLHMKKKEMSREKGKNLMARIMSISALIMTIAISLSIFVESTTFILILLTLALLIPLFYLMRRWLK